MEMPYFGPSVKNMASVKCHISVKKISLEGIVWSTGKAYRQEKLHQGGFISKEEMETGENWLIPMSHLGLGSLCSFESSLNSPWASGKRHSLKLTQTSVSNGSRYPWYIAFHRFFLLKTFLWKNREVSFFWIAKYADAETTHEPDCDSGARLSFNA